MVKKLTVLVTLVIAFFCACAKSSGKIVIWTSGEDYKNEMYITSLKEKFPQYNIVLEYMSSSAIAAKVMQEKEKCSCDIILSEEYGYLAMCSDYLAKLGEFDFSIFENNLVPSNHKYTPEVKNSGAVIVNKKVLKERNLPKPKTYEDLLKPAYKNLISMPNPASSGTGYMFLKNLVNVMGEDKAFAYFDKLTNNILSYTSGGSGAVNALVHEEVAIGLGMISQAVQEINNGVDLEILVFDEGSPYSMYGNAVLAGKSEKAGVMEVFNYLSTDLAKKNNQLFFPDKIFKNFAPTVKNYPVNMPSADMTGDTREEKQRLLSKWNH